MVVLCVMYSRLVTLKSFLVFCFTYISSHTIHSRFSALLFVIFMPYNMFNIYIEKNIHNIYFTFSLFEKTKQTKAKQKPTYQLYLTKTIKK